MATAHSEVLALLGQWRAELDAEAPAIGFDVAALRDRERARSAQWPTIAHEVCAIRDAAAAAAAGRTHARPDFLAPDTVDPCPSAHPPGPAWIPDSLWPQGSGAVGHRTGVFFTGNPRGRRVPDPPPERPYNVTAQCGNVEI
jgi:hypothetical protein